MSRFAGGAGAGIEATRNPQVAPKLRRILSPCTPTTDASFSGDPVWEA